MSPVATWWNAFPALKDIQDPRWHALMAKAQEVRLPARTAVFHAGDPCRNFLFVLGGSVRVEKIAENGREVVLYRVGRGETCLLTTSCLIARERYPAAGVTETEVRAVALPHELFQEALAISPEFRAFVFASFGARLTDLIALIEAIAFGRGEARLARRLLDSGGTGGAVAATHQELAAELGTAREVVSRFLKEFEHRGLVRLRRGHIEITDRPGLEALGASL